ncbi:MAG: DUF3526 domain-containing protein [Litorimonas sp.]
MTDILKREFRFLLRDRAALLWIAIGFVLSAIAVLLGLLEIDRQLDELDALRSLDQQERAAVLSEQSDWGGAAYYTFHLTADPPSDFAFAAIGQRDTSPWKHRVRMLALEGQIYETDAGNPDLALVGRFDFAFVASLLAPLLVILLLFDLRSGEAAAGRLSLIEASARDPRSLWRARVAWRTGALTVALLAPLWVGGMIAGTGPFILLAASLTVALYLAFWSWLTSRIATEHRTGSVNLTLLLGIWIGLCAVLPAALTTAIERAVPLPDTGEIMLTQREAVNDAWDLPKAATMEPFTARHPEWETVVTPEEGFDWGWYYAFQQVGDQTVEPLSLAYREGRARRDRLAGWSSLLSPATGTQRIMERLAHTDAAASLAYEARIRDFHARLRAWHYPRFYEGRSYVAAEAIETTPRFSVDDR